MRAIVMISLMLLAPLSMTGCLTGACADAIDYADDCGVPDLEVEDDIAGCGDTFECRSKCVLEASCDEVVKTFGPAGDRTTKAWTCYEACGI